MAALIRCGAARRVGALFNVINYSRFLPHVPGRFGAAVIRAAGLVFATLLGQSFFWSTANPRALQLLVAGVALLAAARPDVALLVLAAAVPFGRVISALMSPARPVGITEALVLAYLAGWFWGRLRRRVDDGPESPGLRLGYLFAAVVVASLLVDIAILRYWKDYWQPFLWQLFTYLARDYLNVGVEFRPWADSFGGLPSAVTAARFLEGLALVWPVQVLCARDPAFGRRLLRTVTIAAVGTAILSAGMALQVANAGGRSLLSVYQTDRIAVHVTKVNTAGSSFVLFLPVLIGLAVSSTQSSRRPLSVRSLRWTVAAAGAGLLLGALWLTGSRAALVAGIVVALGTSVYAVTRCRPEHRTWRSAGWVTSYCVVAALLGFWLYLKARAGENTFAIGYSFFLRILMWRGALSSLSAHPLFGTGIGQFQYQVGAFVSDEEVVRARLGGVRFSAHNQFLEVAAELGVIGGLLFIGMFAAILWRAWTAFRASRDPALGGALAGVIAFLITCLAGQPLLHDVVAFPFWMVLGVVLAGGNTSTAALSARQSDTSRRFKCRLIAWFMIVLAISIPVRVWQGKDQVNFALADYGFSEWHYPSDGRFYRLVRDNGTFFTYPHARGLKLPIRRDVEAGRHRLEVDVSLDGRRARTLTLADDEWQTVEFMIPADARRRFRRIDLAVRAPAGVPAQVRIAPAEISEDQTVEQGRAR